MPLKRNVRLDRVVRKKLRRLLFRFYEMLQREGTPPRFAKLLIEEKSNIANRAQSPNRSSRPPT
jgi:hypothetical protein